MQLQTLSSHEKKLFLVSIDVIIGELYVAERARVLRVLLAMFFSNPLLDISEWFGFFIRDRARIRARILGKLAQ